MRVGSAAGVSVPVLSAVGVNAVPAAGLLFGGWPPETTLAVYIVETALLVALTALRLRLFAPPQLVTASGRAQPRAEAIQGFVLLTGGFTAGGAIFSAFFLWRSLDLAVTQQALAASLASFALFQGMGLVADMLLLRQPSQAVIERWMLPGLRRGCVLYGAVMLGGFGAVVGLGGYIYPFLALKLLFDLGTAFEEAIARLRNLTPPSPGLLDIAVTRPGPRDS